MVFENWGDKERCIFCQPKKEDPSEGILLGPPERECRFYPEEVTRSGLQFDCSPECEFYLAESVGFNILKGFAIQATFGSDGTESEEE